MYKFMSYQENVGKNHSTKIGDKYFGKIAKLNIWAGGGGGSNQNCIFGTLKGD
jgi:hypothetical protein